MLGDAPGAEWTAKKLGGKGKVALLMGPSGAPTFKNLGDGYSEVMAKHPEIHIVFRSDGPLTRERGVKQAEDVLVANPDLAAIYTANDDVALGAAQAVLADRGRDLDCVGKGKSREQVRARAVVEAGFETGAPLGTGGAGGAGAGGGGATNGGTAGRASAGRS